MIKRISILLLGPIVIALVSSWVYLQGGRYVGTENAYLKSEIITVSSELSGKVLEVFPKNNERVKKGDLVIRLFDQPYLIAISRAEANLANVHGDLLSQKAEYESRKLDISSAETDFEFRALELKRMQQLRNENSVSVAQFDQSQFAWKTSYNELEAKKQELLVSKAKLIDPEKPVEEHPRYLQSLAELTKAELDLSYVEVKSPAEGIATNVSSHVGENILSGTNLFSIVDDSEIWIEANFKETDLTNVRAGQPVTIKIDTYPDVEWHGEVASITPATGSEFSLLPAQNSSGNWIKVVQRIMVKIAFEPQGNNLPLSTGMSAEVSIDTGHVRNISWLTQNLNDFIRGI